MSFLSWAVTGSLRCSATRTSILPLVYIRSLSGSGGIDKHFAPYPALPKTTPKDSGPSPPSAFSSGGSELFRDLNLPAFGTEMSASNRWASVHDAVMRDMALLRDTKDPGNVYTGRSVTVTDGIDVSIAYRRLHMILSRNRVRSELFLQRRYEKPSDRERRLKSERHRRRFAAWVSTE
jgi:ribosomal protein S21